MNWEYTAKTLAAVAGALAGFLWGGWSQMLAILLFFVIVDYITGFAAAAIEGRLNSNVGLKGIAKKVMIFAVIAIAYQIDKVVGTGTTILRDAVTAFYLWNEALSILENIGRTGLPLPDRLKNAVEVLRGKAEERNDEK